MSEWHLFHEYALEIHIGTPTCAHHDECRVVGMFNPDDSLALSALATTINEKLDAKDAEILRLTTLADDIHADWDRQAKEIAALSSRCQLLVADRNKWREALYNAQPSSEQIGQLEAKVAAGDAFAHAVRLVVQDNMLDVNVAYISVRGALGAYEAAQEKGA